MVDISNFKKIALCGSHRVGKTTLSKKISEIFGYNYIPEVARELFSHLSYEFDFKTCSVDIYYYFEYAIYYSHMFFIKAISPPFISDRSIFDIASYCFYRNTSKLNKIGEMIIETNKYNISSLYDCLLLYSNGYSTKDESAIFIHNQIHSMLEWIKLRNLIPVFEISRGDEIVYNNKVIVV